MDKKITDLTMEEVSKLAWDEMDEKQRTLITSVLKIKKDCLVLIEDQFTQQFHDVGDELYDLVERCEGDPYTGVSGGDALVRIIIEICDKYLLRNLGNIAGRLNWLEGEMCSWMKLGEKSGGLPINERIDIGNDTIKKLQQLVGALEKCNQIEEIA